MRHRAPRPLLDRVRGLAPVVARRLTAVSRLGPLRSAVALATAIVVAVGVLVSVASVQEGTWVASEPGPSGEPTASAADGAAGPRSPSTPVPSASGMPSRRAPAATSPTARSTAPAPTSEPSPSPTLPEALPSSLPPSSALATPTPSSAPSVSDTEAPETGLTSTFGEDGSATHLFDADEPASFECSLDGAAFASCGSPVSHDDLDAGWHTFAVRAVDDSGNVDPTPAETRWHARSGRSG